MTIDSVANTLPAVINPQTSTAKPPSTVNSGSIPLTVPPNPQAARMWSQGVPLPYQGVSSTSEMIIKNESGVEVPAQFDIIGSHQDGSISQVLVTTTIAADTTQEKIYTLDYGAGVSQSSYSTNFGYTESSTEIVVSTGNARFTIDKANGQIKSAHADTGGDQTYTTQVLSAAEFYAQDGFDDTNYSSDNEVAANVSIIRSGAFHLLVHVDGYFRDVSNNAYSQFRANYYFYKDTDFVDIEATLVDDTQQPSRYDYWTSPTTQQVAYACRKLGFKFDHSIASGQQYIIGGEIDGSNNYTGSVSSEVYLMQSGNRYINQHAIFSADKDALTDDATGLTLNYSGVGTGTKAKGYATLHNGSVGFTIMLQDMFKHWPMELSVDTGSCEARLFPDRYHGGTVTTTHTADADGFLIEPNCLYHGHEGLAKTYSLRIQIHKAAPNETNIENTLDDLNTNAPQLRATAAHYCSANRFNKIDPSDSVSSLRDANLLTIQRRAETEYINGGRGPHRTLNYGWRWYGDRYRHGSEHTIPTKIMGAYNGAHFVAPQFFIMYERTLEQDWLEAAVRETRHFMDIDVAHCTATGYYSALDPVPAGFTRTGDHKDVDHDVAVQNDSHTNCAAIAQYYFLTGSYRAKEVMQEIADHVEHITPLIFPLPRPSGWVSGRSRALGERAFIEAERDVGWLGHNMTQYVAMSNDADYHRDVTSTYIKFLIDWWKEAGNHYIRDEVVSYSDYTTGTGYWLLDQSDNSNGSFKTNGPSPWMSASIFQSCLQWYRDELKFGNSGIDLQEFRNMLYQCIQFVNYWGWNETAQNYHYSMDPQYQSPGGDDNGARLLCSPMSEIYLLYKADLDASPSRITNPEWFDHATWKSRLLTLGTRFETIPYESGTHWNYPMGGYEFLYPCEFWVNLKLIRAE